MNLKERGVTVGDLLIISIIIISAILLTNKFKDNDKESYIHWNPKIVYITRI